MTGISFFDVVYRRKSVRSYDPTVTISKEELQQMLRQAMTAPSSKNLQHWHFMVVQGKKRQKELFHIANEQSFVQDAAAVVIVLGDQEAYKNGDKALQDAVLKGKLSLEGKQSRMERIMRTYEARGPLFPRDAAIMNASLAAMQLMLIATAYGYATCPIGGFNPTLLRERYHIADRYTPVMLITIGKELQTETMKRTKRLDENHFITFVTDDDAYDTNKKP